MKKLVALLLVLVTAGIVAGIAAASIDTVSQDEAKSVAKKFIARISAIEDAKITSALPVLQFSSTLILVRLPRENLCFLQLKGWV